MGFFKSILRYFCDHDYTNVESVTLLDRPGTMVVILSCGKCGSILDTFHDLTETEEIIFRHPQTEKALIDSGYLIRKNGKLTLNPKRKFFKS
jgi:hypothetical protein